MLLEKKSGRDRRLMLYFGVLSRCFPRLAATQALRLFTRPMRHRTPEREIEYARGARQFVDANGLYTTVWGETSSKTVLLVHGWSSRGTQLGAFSKPLVENGYRVIAVDGPAHGQSAGTYTQPREFYDMLFRLEREWGPFAAIIGHSFGAGCTTWALSEGLKSEKFVFVSSAANFDDIVDRYADYLNLSKRARVRFYQLIRKNVRRSEPLLIAELLGTLKQPLLIIHDRDDREIGIEVVERLKKGAPKARFLVTEGLGHHRILRDPAVIEAVVRFIREDR